MRYDIHWTSKGFSRINVPLMWVMVELKRAKRKGLPIIVEPHS